MLMMNANTDTNTDIDKNSVPNTVPNTNIQIQIQIQIQFTPLMGFSMGACRMNDVDEDCKYAYKYRYR